MHPVALVTAIPAGPHRTGSSCSSATSGTSSANVDNLNEVDQGLRRDRLGAPVAIEHRRCTWCTDQFGRVDIGEWHRPVRPVIQQFHIGDRDWYCAVRRRQQRRVVLVVTGSRSREFRGTGDQVAVLTSPACSAGRPGPCR